MSGVLGDIAESIEDLQDIAAEEDSVEGVSEDESEEASSETDVEQEESTSDDDNLSSEDEEGAEGDLDSDEPDSDDSGEEGQDSTTSKDKTPGEDDSGTDEELDEGDVDPFIPVKVDGVESEVPLSEIIATYQKNKAADSRLQQAQKSLQTADFFYKKLQAVEESGLAGMPMPMQSLIQILAGRHNGDLALAQKELNTVILPRYVQALKQFEENPDLLNVKWKRYSLDEKERELVRKQEELDQKTQKAELDRKVAAVEPVFQRLLKDHGVDFQSPEALRVGKIILGKLVDGQSVTKEVIEAEVRKVSSDLEVLLQRKLESLSPEQLEKLNPKLGKAVTKLYAKRAKKAQATKGQQAGSESPTKPRRRKPEAQEFYDDIEGLPKAPIR